MKTSIKTTIGIIAIALSSISIAQAGQNRHERDHDRQYDRGNFHYEKSRHARHVGKHQRRHHWKRAHRAQHRYFDRHGKRHMRAYERTRRNHSGWRRGGHHVEKRDSYVLPRHRSPRVSVSTRIHSNNALPIIAGGLIGSTIANDASNGDPGATFGGAIFGALVGNAIARH